MINKILILLTTTLSFASVHKDIIIEKQYGNIHLVTVMSNYVEELNKTLIIGQYAKLLCENLNIRNQVNLTFIENSQDESITGVVLNKEGEDELNIVIKLKSFDIKGCLNVIEYLKLHKKIKNYQQIYNSGPSELVVDIMNNKIYRPDEIPELNQKYFTYYIKDGKYFLMKQNSTEDENIVTSNIMQFVALTGQIFVFFEKNNILRIVIWNGHSEEININEVDNYFRPYEIKMLSMDKISFIYPERSSFKNRVMVYFINKNVLCQNIDSFISN